MTKLRILDLTNNRLSYVSPQAQIEFNSLRLKHSNITVDMARNPFECSCDTLASLQWIRDHKTFFTKFEQYSCSRFNTMIAFTSLNYILDQLQSQSSFNIIIGTSAGLLGFVVLVIAISVCIHRHKWDIRFFFIKFVAKRNVYQKLEEARIEYEFDAFVAYHKNDMNWVLNELFENLGDTDPPKDVPNQPRFRLCLHDRNFIPGDTIEDNIVRAIERSRKTILVLSKSFLTSEWCRFELQMARMESFEQGRNLIITVMLESLPIDTMPRTLRRMVEKNTHIVWSDDPNQKTIFWGKMRRALDREPEEFVCECGSRRTHRAE